MSKHLLQTIAATILGASLMVTTTHAGSPGKAPQVRSQQRASGWSPPGSERGFGFIMPAASGKLKAGTVGYPYEVKTRH
jgi:hypothetical protein